METVYLVEEEYVMDYGYELGTQLESRNIGVCSSKEECRTLCQRHLKKITAIMPMLRETETGFEVDIPDWNTIGYSIREITLNSLLV